MKNSFLFLIALYGLFTSCIGRADAKSSCQPSKEACVKSIIPKSSSSICIDRYGKCWYTNKRDFISMYNTKTGTIDVFDDRHGLSSKIVYCFLEDQFGQVWMGTADGITIYDGRNFKKYSISDITGRFSASVANSFNTNKASSDLKNSVAAMMLDSEGKIWVAIQNELFVFNGRTFNKFIPSNASELSSNDTKSCSWIGIERILEDNQGRIWCGGRGLNGAYCIYDNKLMLVKPSESEKWLMPIAQTKDGKLWLNDKDFGSLAFQRNDLSKDQLFPYWDLQVLEDSKGNVWFNNGENWGITKYDGKEYTNYDSTALKAFYERNYLSMALDSDDVLYLTTINGELIIFDGKEFKVLMDGC
jgi:ligand-binding sensor domain-containing protein